MRTRAEIEENIKIASQSSAANITALNSLIISELLLDIRDILSEERVQI